MSDIDAFQQEVLQAYRRFATEVAAAARRAVHGIAEATITAAFDQALDRILYALAVKPIPLPARDRAPRGRVALRIDPAAAREQLLAAIRDKPGCTAAQLARALSIRTPSLLRHLRTLTHEGVLRTERQPSAFPGQSCKLYFVAEPAAPEPHLNGEIVAAPTATEALE